MGKTGKPTIYGHGNVNEKCNGHEMLMENTLYVYVQFVDFPIETTISSECPMATFDDRRVNMENYHF